MSSSAACSIPLPEFPQVGASNLQDMIAANRKWLEHYKNDPKLYPFSCLPNPDPFPL